MFYALLQTALWGKPITGGTKLTAEETDSLFETAKKQSVLGLISHVLTSNDVTLESQHVMLAMGYQRKIAKKNKKNITDLLSLTRFMQRSGVPMVVVKGQTLGALYPMPELRQNGDIDFFCGTDGFNDARNAISQKLKIEFPSHTPVKHQEFEINDTKYELHRILSILSMPKSQRRFNEIMENGLAHCDHVCIEGQDVPVLPPTENILFQTVHIFYHIYKEGIGLRQLCDFAVFLRKKYAETDFGKLREWLDDIHMRKIFEAIASIAIAELGMPFDNMEQLFAHFAVAKDKGQLKKLARNIMEDVEKGGNFGNALEDKRIVTILKHYARYVSAAPYEILFIPYEKLTRRLRGF